MYAARRSVRRAAYIRSGRAQPHPSGRAHHRPFGEKVLKVVFVVVEPSQKHGQPVDSDFEVGVEIGEVAQAFGEPAPW